MRDIGVRLDNTRACSPIVVHHAIELITLSWKLAVREVTAVLLAPQCALSNDRVAAPRSVAVVYAAEVAPCTAIDAAVHKSALVLFPAKMVTVLSIHTTPRHFRSTGMVVTEVAAG